jgi:hypothetical protein
VVATRAGGRCGGRAAPTARPRRSRSAADPVGQGGRRLVGRRAVTPGSAAAASARGPGLRLRPCPALPGARPAVTRGSVPGRAQVLRGAADHPGEMAVAAPRLVPLHTGGRAALLVDAFAPLGVTVAATTGRERRSCSTTTAGPARCRSGCCTAGVRRSRCDGRLALPRDGAVAMVAGPRGARARAGAHLPLRRARAAGPAARPARRGGAPGHVPRPYGPSCLPPAASRSTSAAGRAGARRRPADAGRSAHAPPRPAGRGAADPGVGRGRARDARRSQRGQARSPAPRGPRAARALGPSPSAGRRGRHRRRSGRAACRPGRS